MRVRAIQSFHMDSRGWCDVGYHFLVAPDGTVFEGRPLSLLGAHVGGHNRGNVGIAFLGCFDPVCDAPESPTPSAIEAAGEVGGAVARHFDVAVSPETFRGHREHEGAATACPGEQLLLRLDDLRGFASP